APEFLLVDNRQQMPPALPRLIQRIHEATELRTAPQQMADTLRNLWQMFLELGLEHRRGADRQQTDHRAYLETLRAAVRPAQGVVEEPILLVPHAVGAVPHHG